MRSPVCPPTPCVRRSRLDRSPHWTLAGSVVLLCDRSSQVKTIGAGVRRLRTRGERDPVVPYRSPHANPRRRRHRRCDRRSPVCPLLDRRRAALPVVSTRAAAGAGIEARADMGRRLVGSVGSEPARHAPGAAMLAAPVVKPPCALAASRCRPIQTSSRDSRGRSPPSRRPPVRPG